MTDDSRDVVGSVSGERMGDGPDKGGGIDLTEETDNSEDATESGSRIRVAILVVDTDRVVSTGELVVGEGGG